LLKKIKIILILLSCTRWKRTYWKRKITRTM